MWKLLTILLLATIAVTLARPSTSTTTEDDKISHQQNMTELIKQTKHLTDEEIIQLEQQGKQILAEMKEKKLQLEVKAKEEIEGFLKLAEVLKQQAKERADQFKKETEEIKSEELPFNFNQGCMTDDDCSEATMCYPVDKALQTVLQAFDDLEEYQLIAKKARITGNECVPRFSKQAMFFEVGNILALFNEKKEKLVEKFESKKADLEQKGVNTTFIDTSFLLNGENIEKHIFEVVEVITADDYDETTVNSEPTVRQLSSDKLSIDPMTLMILGNRGKDSFDTQSLMMSMMMAGSAASGDHQSLTSNPLLLMTMMDSADDSTAADLLLKMTLLGAGEGSSASLLSNPLLLTSLLGEDVDQNTLVHLMISQNSGSIVAGDISPLLLMSVMNSDLKNDPLMLMSLLGDDISPATVLLLSDDC